MANQNKSSSQKKLKKDIGHRSHELIISIFIIILLTVIVYSPAFNAQFLNWDDDVMVVNNYSIRNLTQHSIAHMFSSININSYNPLILLTYAIEYKFFGLSAGAFHVINIVIHIINCLLIFLLIYLLIKDNIIALFTALLFSVHPLHVEASLWVTSLKELLFSMFYILSVISYINYSNKSKRIYFTLSLLLFILSILSKSVAVTLPALLVLIDYYSSGKFEPKRLLDKIPFFIIALIFSVVTIYTFSKGEQIGSPYNAVDDVLIFFYSIFFYLYKLILPFGLSPVYPFPVKSNRFLPIIYLLSPVILIVLTVFLFKIKKYRREIVFGIMFFIITILPVSNIIPVTNNSLVFDRFTYIPYTGLFLLICLMLFERNDYKTARQNPAFGVRAVIVSVIILIFSVISYQRSGDWQNSTSLWRNAADQYPNNPLVYSLLGEAYYRNGDVVSALTAYNTAIKIDSVKSDYYNDRGNVLRDSKDFNRALSDYERAIRLDNRNWGAYNNLGIMYAYEKKYDFARVYFDEALSIKNDYANAYLNKGNLYLDIQKFDSALIAYDNAIRIDDFNPDYYIAQGICYTKMQKYTEAISDYKKVLLIDPDHENAYQRLTYTYYLNKDYYNAWETLNTMRSKNFRIDRNFLEMLQKESGRMY